MGNLSAELWAEIERRDRETNLLEQVARILDDESAAAASVNVEGRIRALAQPNGGVLTPEAPRMPQVAQLAPGWPVNGQLGGPFAPSQVPYNLTDVLRKAETPEMVAQRVQQQRR